MKDKTALWAVQVQCHRPVLCWLLCLVLAACASPPPPPQLYQLRALPPVPVVSVSSQQVLQLLQPVALPELLERDALLVPQGQAGVQALVGHRWAELLRDAVPRLLRQDLAALLGENRVWVAPLPAGVVVTRQLRVEILALQIAANRNTVSLQARWTLSDPSGRAPPGPVAAGRTSGAGCEVDRPEARAPPNQPRDNSIGSTSNRLSH